jgi:hypothetical protein
MANQYLIAKDMTQIPAAVAELWGKPPVLPHEDPEVYNKLWLEIAKSIGPTDFIEWLWIKDILDLSWEIRRLRGFKAGLAEKCRRDRIERIISRGRREGDTPAVAELAELESEASVAGMFVEDMSRYERIDELLVSQESRRNAVLREIERRRESVASRLRKASDDIIDGEFTEAPASESGTDQASLGNVDRDPSRDAA